MAPGTPLFARRPAQKPEGVAIAVSTPEAPNQRPSRSATPTSAAREPAIALSGEMPFSPANAEVVRPVASSPLQQQHRTLPRWPSSTPSSSRLSTSCAAGSPASPSPAAGRRHGYRITFVTGAVQWLGKQVCVYVQLVGDIGKTGLTRVVDRSFDANTSVEFIVFAPSVGNVRKLYVKHSAELTGCVMELRRAFVVNEDLQRAWSFRRGVVLDYDTRNEAILEPSSEVFAGRRAARQHLQELSCEAGEGAPRDPLVKRLTFRLNFFAKDSQTMYVLGSTPSLGQGDVDRAVRMTRVRDEQDVFRGDWHVDIETDELDEVEYRYVLLVDATRTIVYESNPERRLHIAGEEGVERVEGGIADDDDEVLAAQAANARAMADGLSLEEHSDNGAEEADNNADDANILAENVLEAEDGGAGRAEGHDTKYNNEPACEPLNLDVAMLDDQGAAPYNKPDAHSPGSFLSPRAPAAYAHLEQQIAGLQHELDLAHERWRGELVERRRLFNCLQELRGNVRVFCRCRPTTHQYERVAVDFTDREQLSHRNEFDLPRALTTSGGKTFEFDRVYAPEDDQETVYKDLEALVGSVLDGYNVCVFAYGQTGSGKTYTMNGDSHAPGINYRALNDLFRLAAEQRGSFNTNISISMLEIYNEQVRDLLGECNARLDVKQGNDGVFVPGLSWRTAETVQEVWGAMRVGASNRAKGATNMNEHSSRSHLVLSVAVERANATNGDGTQAKLHLVDLAGSERLSRTNATGDRLKEAQHINKSLAALGDVFNSILVNNAHVPFRNSKLTYLLKDSLGGDAKTLMVVNVSPAECDAAETLSSLNFASRVSKAELGAARRNVDSAESRRALARSAELESEMAQLRQRNQSLESEVCELQRGLSQRHGRDMQAQEAKDMELQQLRQRAVDADNVKHTLLEENHILNAQLREALERCREVSVSSQESASTELETHAQHAAALQRQAPAAQISHAKPATASPVMSTKAPTSTLPNKHAPNAQSLPGVPASSLQSFHQPTRSILAELNRDDCSDASSVASMPPPAPSPRGNHTSTRPSSVAMAGSNIPRPRPSRTSGKYNGMYGAPPPSRVGVPKGDSTSSSMSSLNSGRRPSTARAAPDYTRTTASTRARAQGGAAHSDGASDQSAMLPPRRRLQSQERPMSLRGSESNRSSLASNRGCT